MTPSPARHRDQLDRVAEELLKCETLDAATFNHLIGRKAAAEKSSETKVEAAPETLGRI